MAVSHEDKELADYIIQNIDDIVFLVGAGISMERFSWLPAWAKMIETILESIEGEENSGTLKYIMKYNDLLLNEAIFRFISDVYGIKEAGVLLKLCLETQAFSLPHRFFAWSSLFFGCPILSMNFDNLIEAAAEDYPDKKSITIFHLHGSINKVEKARFTLDSIFSPIPQDNIADLMRSIHNKKLIVFGYRGADEFDIIPFIFKLMLPSGIVWTSKSKEGIKDKKLKERVSLVWEKEDKKITVGNKGNVVVNRYFAPCNGI
jgi:hypothetical protein